MCVSLIFPCCSYVNEVWSYSYFYFFVYQTYLSSKMKRRGILAANGTVSAEVNIRKTNATTNVFDRKLGR